MLMKIPLIALMLFLAHDFVVGQVTGNPFPSMPAETVNDEKVVLPEHVKGNYTLIGLAYSKKSEDELNSWFQPVVGRFIQKTNG